MSFPVEMWPNYVRRLVDLSHLPDSHFGTDAVSDRWFTLHDHPVGGSSKFILDREHDGMAMYRREYEGGHGGWAIMRGEHLYIDQAYVWATDTMCLNNIKIERSPHIALTLASTGIRDEDQMGRYRALISEYSNRLSQWWIMHFCFGDEEELML